MWSIYIAKETLTRCLDSDGELSTTQQIILLYYKINSNDSYTHCNLPAVPNFRQVINMKFLAEVLRKIEIQNNREIRKDWNIYVGEVIIALRNA